MLEIQTKHYPAVWNVFTPVECIPYIYIWNPSFQQHWPLGAVRCWSEMGASIHCSQNEIKSRRWMDKIPQPSLLKGFVLRLCASRCRAVALKLNLKLDSWNPLEPRNFATGTLYWTVGTSEWSIRISNEALEALLALDPLQHETESSESQITYMDTLPIRNPIF